MVRRSILISTKILRLINKIQTKDILIVLNVMITNPRQKNTMQLDELNEIFIEKFLKNDTFLFNAQHWNIYGDDKLYSYHGTGKKGKTVMSTLILWK
jgi:CO dehydrogenase nickel-insertion accessory protein CooC1